MKFLRFQKVDLQALVNAERSANSCNNRRLHRRWATIVSALPTTTLQVALGTPKILPNALLCPQSPPNRFLRTPLCPSSKATAWVFALCRPFLSSVSKDEYFNPQSPKTREIGTIVYNFLFFNSRCRSS